MIRVLVVDDIAFIRSVIKDILIEEGFNVVGEASDGAHALSLYKALKPDIVLMDIMMPIMDGVEALKRVLEYDPRGKVIMCSSLGDQKSIINAISLGAKDFVVKPFRRDRILSAIKKTAL